MDYPFCDVGVSFLFIFPFDLPQNSGKLFPEKCTRNGISPRDLCNPSLFMTENDTKEAILHGGFENDCFKINSNYSVFQAAT